MIRTPIALIPYLLAAAVVASGILWHAGDFVSVTTVGEARIGGPFTLTDQYGKTGTDHDFRGRFMLVYFGYTNCPDVCPTTLAVMADALDKLKGADRIVPIFITIDPARDTPKVLALYLKAFGPRFVGLTGSDTAIAAVSRAYGVYAAKRDLKGGGYSMDHSSRIVLMGPDGKFVAVYDETLGPDGLRAELAKHI